MQPNYREENYGPGVYVSQADYHLEHGLRMIDEDIQPGMEVLRREVRDNDELHYAYDYLGKVVKLERERSWTIVYTDVDLGPWHIIFRDKIDNGTGSILKKKLLGDLEEQGYFVAFNSYAQRKIGSMLIDAGLSMEDGDSK